MRVETDHAIAQARVEVPGGSTRNSGTAVDGTASTTSAQRTRTSLGPSWAKRAGTHLRGGGEHPTAEQSCWSSTEPNGFELPGVGAATATDETAHDRSSGRPIQKRDDGFLQWFQNASPQNDGGTMKKTRHRPWGP